MVHLIEEVRCACVFLIREFTSTLPPLDKGNNKPKACDKQGELGAIISDATGPAMADRYWPWINRSPG